MEKKRITFNDLDRVATVPMPRANMFLHYPYLILGWVFGNILRLSPNMITLLSFIAVIFSAYLSITGHLIGGALFFLLRLLLDNVDGKLARLWGVSSRWGGIFDWVTGYIGTALITIALFYNLNETLIFLLTPFIILMSLIHPLQHLVVILILDKEALNKMKHARYNEWMYFEDCRLIAFVLIPILASFFTIKSINLYALVLYSIMLVILKNIGWMAYYYRPLRHVVLRTFARDTSRQEADV